MRRVCALHTGEERRELLPVSIGDRYRLYYSRVLALLYRARCGGGQLLYTSLEYSSKLGMSTVSCV